jgi:hypothetical protein
VCTEQGKQCRLRLDCKFPFEKRMSLVSQKLPVVRDLRSAAGSTRHACDLCMGRSPWSNKYDPPLTDGSVPSDRRAPAQIDGFTHGFSTPTVRCSEICSSVPLGATAAPVCQCMCVLPPVGLWRDAWSGQGANKCRLHGALTAAPRPFARTGCSIRLAASVLTCLPMCLCLCLCLSAFQSTGRPGPSKDLSAQAAAAASSYG